MRMYDSSDPALSSRLGMPEADDSLIDEASLDIEASDTMEDVFDSARDEAEDDPEDFCVRRDTLGNDDPRVGPSGDPESFEYRLATADRNAWSSLL